MSRTDVIAKIAKLVSLAGNNPNENEARTAAHLACKLMNEHKLTVGGESSGRSEAEYSALGERFLAASKRVTDLTSELRDAERVLDEVVTNRRQLRDENAALRAELAALRAGNAPPQAKKAPPAAAPAPSAPASAPGPRRRSRPFRGAARFMAAKFAGVCDCCGTSFDAGAPIAYYGKAAHAECYRAEDASAA